MNIHIGFGLINEHNVIKRTELTEVTTTFTASEMAKAIRFQEKYYDTTVVSLDGSSVRVKDIEQID